MFVGCCSSVATVSVVMTRASRPMKYLDAVKCLLAVLNKPLLVRLAKCDTIAQIIYALQQDLDEVVNRLGLAKSVELTRWRDEWESDRAEQMLILTEEVTKATGRELLDEISRKEKVEEARMDLKVELGKDIPQDRLDPKNIAFERVLQFSNMEEVSVPAWYISSNDLVFVDRPVTRGTFGDVFRAMWFHDRVRQNVVVKQLFADISEATHDPFIKLLNAWHRLRHRNILQLFGACVIGSQCFFVCEDADQGNLTDYTRKHRINPKLLWDVFVQVTEGLAFLHENGIVHGRLTCKNILVADGDTPKLSDFGFEAIRTLSVSMSSYHNQTASRQPQPIEMFKESETLRSTSDIYSLGICIFETIGGGQKQLHIDPQSHENDRQSHDTVGAEAWKLIKRLCATDYHQRPSVSEALLQMHKLRVEGDHFLLVQLGNLSSRVVLQRPASQCGRIPESENMFHRLLKHLEAVHDSVVFLKSEDQWKQKYIDVILRFNKLTLDNRPLLLRLAHIDTLMDKLNALHLQLDEVPKELDILGSPQWGKHWSTDCAESIEFNDQVDGRTAKRYDDYGYLRQGTWLHGGKCTAALIKCFFDKDWEIEHGFIEHTELWEKMDDNEYILKFYGGSHISNSLFYVCENAPYGTVIEYFAHEQNIPCFWKLFLQVAQGLEFLHNKGFLHGNLRCMCMIEAITHEPPFGIEDDDVILEHILNGEQYPRPDNISDTAWSFISQLCNPDLTKRPPLDHVITELQAFAASFVDPTTKIDALATSTVSAEECAKFVSCSSCINLCDTDLQWCRYCGSSLKIHKNVIIRQSFAKYVKSHSRQDVLRKIFDVSIALQELQDQDIVHGDLKPANIFIGRDGSAHLSNFNCSMNMSDAANCSSFTTPRDVRWLAPECMRGRNPDLASDIYSLGLCMIFGLTGEPPWSVDVSDEQIKHEVYEMHKMPPQSSKVVETDIFNLIKRMCVYDPKKKIRITEVVDELAKVAPVNADECLKWRMTRNNIYFQEDKCVSRTLCVSRYLGWWKDEKFQLRL
ncbi:unnamed protein product [Phytophthora lilii]|uniref:Unnamed protein product n=1 Tax=Phytophthora lilii TaxID=2077276 RepID=A0A9W6THT6_9STRA|nr:unnamed protein product [Phytophthora lilii]